MVTYSIRQQSHHKAEKPRSNTGLIISLISAILLLAICTYLAHKHTLTGLQARLFYDVDNLNLPKHFTTAARWLTEGLGAAYPIIACVLIAALFKNFYLAWRFALTVGIAVVIAEVLKYGIKEPRPITMLAGHLHQRVIETGPGFPSGHETVATALALTLWFVLPRRYRILSVIWLVVLAFSRLYLGVHTPADIIGGFAIGLLAVCVVRLLPPGLARTLRLEKG
ncbi:MAG TPA: phosphatase PAP2 family protein [Candidatus Binatia bacterium]|nr:phosphatase PAP2 family protein [Candidatus Binatia bacterium]